MELDVWDEMQALERRFDDLFHGASKTAAVTEAKAIPVAKG